MRKIVIDPGHGGRDPGAIGLSGKEEKGINLATSLILRELLKEYQVEPFLTRDRDLTLELEKRVAITNELKADLLISIHCNSYSLPQARGIEIWYSFNGRHGKVFFNKARTIAQSIQNKLIQATGFPNRGIKTKVIDNPKSSLFGQDYYFLLREANCPALIIELGFISNPIEESLLLKPHFQKTLAQGILAGLKEGFSLKKKKPPKIPDDKMGFSQTSIKLKDREFQGFILNSRAFVEVRDFAEFLGLKVHWISEKNQIIIEE